MVKPSSDSRDVATGAASALPIDELNALADEKLLGRYRDTRDMEAFTEMVRRHQPMVFRTCLRLLGNVHDAEDATQSVFLVLAQRPEVVRRSLAGCLHELARAAVSELCRSRRRRSQREEMAARLSALFSQLRGGFQPMEHQELREELDVALAQLPDPLRQAVILRYLEGHSQQEAAQQAGCTQVTIGWRSMKGLKRLRQILGRRGVALAPATLVALLSAEARAAAALSLGRAAAGGATATVAQLTAALVRKAVLANALRKATLVGVLAMVSLGVGAGIVFLPRAAKDEPPKAVAPEVVQAPPVPAPRSRLGLFEHSLDIGEPGHAGAAEFAGDNYTVQGGGRHIYGEADQFRFVYRPWTGDGEIIACVASDPKQDAWQVAAGVMFREALEPDSPHVTVLISGVGHYDVKYRREAGRSSACDISRLDAPGKQWVRLVRQGDTFTAYVRPDGTQTWKLLKVMKLALNPSLYVGLAVTAHDDARLATATFEQVSVRNQPGG
jgi:RNA polymerase sigma factor (sigma-70 family)